MAEYLRTLFCPRDPPSLRPDVASNSVAYEHWLTNEELSRTTTPCAGSGTAPGIGVLIVAEQIDTSQIDTTLSSLDSQTTSAWHAVVAGSLTKAPESDHEVAESRYLDHPKVSLVQLADLPHGGTQEQLTPVHKTAVPAILSAALTVCDLDAVTVLSPGDVLSKDAIQLLAGALSDSDLAYADEDAVDPAGRYVDPVLKPDWSPDLLMSTPYIGRPYVLWKSLLAASGGIASYSGADWEHDLLLRLSEHSSRITHLPVVLCHRPRSAAKRSPESRSSRSDSTNAPTLALKRRRESALVEPGPLPGSWNIKRKLSPDTSIDIVIAFRDGAAFLRNCVDSIVNTSNHLDIRLVLVDNATSDLETLSLMEKLERRANVTLIHDPSPFNWAELNNRAVQSTSGEVIVFLNNDIEARAPGWLDALGAQAMRAEIGAVGARLLYPSGRVQHAGVVVGMGGAAGHVLCGLPASLPGYLGMAVLTRNSTAVTGACLATRRSVFEELGGFDETLGLDLNDIDYCLRARACGYRVVYEPLAELVHYESPSRGTSGSVEDIANFVDRWEQLIRAGDPHLNSNLTRLDCSCALREDDEERWWLNWRSTLNISRANQDMGQS